MRRMLTPLAGLAILVGAPFAASADEVWYTPIGEVIYEQDLPGGQAVFSFPGEGGSRLIAVFNGLAGVTEGRGYYEGAWVDPDAGTDGPCPSAMIDPISGSASHYWGQMDLIFTEPDFPGGWVALRGTCFDNATDYLIGTPLLD